MLKYEDIIKDIQTKSVRRVYLLAGEEPYFIDQLADHFAQHLVEEDARDFNQSVLYGLETNAPALISEVMGMSMLGGLRLVLLREGHMMRDLDAVAPYLSHIPDTTSLVICYKKKADKRKAFYKAVDALGGYYESSKIYDSKVPDFIVARFADKGLKVDQHAAVLMSEHTGNDLEKILSEVTKISIALSGKSAVVTPDVVQEYVGVSKEYNNFELQRALVQRDAVAAYRIARYFASNERSHPIQMTLAVLFNYFSTLMAVYYLPNRDERSIAEALKLSPYAVRDYLLGARNYSSSAVYNIIREIRTADASSKGVDSSLSGGDILIELVAYILNN